MSGQDYLRAASRLATAEGLDPWTALMRVFLPRLHGMAVPATLRPTLALAEHHWAGHPGDLVEAKVAVWRYIEAIQPPGGDLVTPEGRGARALLCVLEPAGDEEARSMTAEWFAAMADDQEAAG